MFQPGGEGEDGELFVPSPLPPRKSPDTAHWDVRPPGPPEVRTAAAIWPSAPSVVEVPGLSTGGLVAGQGPLVVDARDSGDLGPSGYGQGNNDPERQEPDGRYPDERETASNDPEWQDADSNDLDESQAAGRSGREIQWNAKTWAICLSVILLTFAGSAFCLLATQIIPDAASVDPAEHQGIPVAPWGVLILPGASALLAAALGMLAGLFIAAARHYTARAWWHQGAAAAVGIAALAGGFVGIFSEMLFAETLYNPGAFQESYYIPWFIVFQQAALQLLLLGLGALALVAIIRPGKGGVPGRPSIPVALWTGILMSCAGVWTWFASQLYPLVEGRMVTVDEQQSYMVQPWTNIISQAGGPLVLVGSAALFLWVFMLATTRRTAVEPVIEDEWEQVAGNEAG